MTIHQRTVIELAQVPRTIPLHQQMAVAGCDIGVPGRICCLSFASTTVN